MDVLDGDASEMTVVTSVCCVCLSCRTYYVALYADVTYCPPWTYYKLVFLECHQEFIHRVLEQNTSTYIVPSFLLLPALIRNLVWATRISHVAY